MINIFDKINQSQLSDYFLYENKLREAIPQIANQL